MHVLGYKVYFVHYRRFHFSLNRNSRYGLYCSNEPTLDLEKVANQSYPVALEIIFYFGFLITYAVKSLMIPLYMWLPDTHGEAYFSTCMLLAGILLKMGAYKLIQINMELLAHAHFRFSPLLMILGIIQILHATSTSICRHNLKKFISYSSVSHMGFIIIGIGSITSMGLNGAILQILFHGLIGAALFFLGGTCSNRICFVYLEEMGGYVSQCQKHLPCFVVSQWFSSIARNKWFCCRIISFFFGIFTSPNIF
ncbi:hypothetical protein KSP39_PZI001050 [Platanthera zijinensis]|uniref:NADH:quinone oxidoreductase/Mrp antiporter transmembrane domain-containing protein n=1 Tax=Platanthera zijinensis TaxID=2320716 RepID=A0AAP0C1F6_9ASPA